MLGVWRSFAFLEISLVKLLGLRNIRGSSILQMPPENSEASDWFLENLQPHAGPLRAWLERRFPSLNESEDIVQEALVVSLKAHQEGRVQSPKAFLFGTARNLALVALRSQRTRGGQSSALLEELDIEDEGADVQEAVERKQELQILTKAIQALPERCRQIFTLRRVYGMTQREIARKLDLSTRTVNAQLSIGMHKCAKYVERYCRERRI